MQNNAPFNSKKFFTGLFIVLALLLVLSRLLDQWLIPVLKAGLAAAVAEKSASGKKEEQIFSYLLSGLRETEGVTLYGAPGAAGLPYCPILLFNIDGRDSEEVAAALADADVCVARGPALFAAGPPRARHAARRRGPHQSFQAQHVRGGGAVLSNSGPPESPLKRQSGDYSRRYTRLRRESRRRKADF